VALHIEDDEVDRLAPELAAETRESITAAVTIAVYERFERRRGAVPRERRHHAAPSHPNRGRGVRGRLAESWPSRNASGASDQERT